MWLTQKLEFPSFLKFIKKKKKAIVSKMELFLCFPLKMSVIKCIKCQFPKYQKIHAGQKSNIRSK